MSLRLILFIAGLLILTITACNMDSYYATETAEAPTKEAEKALDQKRKDADLPPCDDLHDTVKDIVKGNPHLTGGFGIKDIDNEWIVGVVWESRDTRITCQGDVTLSNDSVVQMRYVGQRNSQGDITVRLFPAMEN